MAATSRPRAECGRLGVGVHEADVLAERAADRDALWQAFVQASVGEGDAPPPTRHAPVVDAALAFVAATPSPLCLPPIEDLLGVEEQPNLPGTIDQHPNWRRRLTVDAGTLLDEPRAAERVDATGSAAATTMTCRRAQPCACSCTATSPSPMRRDWCRIWRTGDQPSV